MHTHMHCAAAERPHALDETLALDTTALHPAHTPPHNIL